MIKENPKNFGGIVKTSRPCIFTRRNMLQTPASLDEEHREMIGALRGYSTLPGKTGAAIKKLEKGIEPHFKKENEIVMPVLGSLQLLIKDEQKLPELREVAESQGAILQEYENMLSEHAGIKKLILEAKQASSEEHHNEVTDLLDALSHHVKVEEEVLYPAALIAGTVAKCILPSQTEGAIA